MTNFSASSQHPTADAADAIDIPSAEITTSTPGFWQRIWRRLRGKRAELVTDAQRSVGENRDHRIKVYTWMQAVRVPFLLLSGWTYMELRNWVLSAILFLISVPISWISVVIGNGKGEKRDLRARTVYKPAAYRQQMYAAAAPGTSASALEESTTTPHALAPGTSADASGGDAASEDAPDAAGSEDAGHGEHTASAS